MSAPANKKLEILAKIEPDGATVRLVGRDAWTLMQLIKAGSVGCTPITHPQPRWSAYVFKLRKAGFIIETEHESHGGVFSGHHGRYRLHSRVSIVSELGRAAA